MRRDPSVTIGERGQSVETSLVESEETCVEAGGRRKYLTQGRRFTEPTPDSPRILKNFIYIRNSHALCPTVKYVIDHLDPVLTD